MFTAYLESIKFTTAMSKQLYAYLSKKHFIAIRLVQK